MSPSSAITPDQLARFHETGYLLIRGAYAPDRVESLRRAVDRALETPPPPGAAFSPVEWFDRAGRLPKSLRHLMHPGRYQPELGAWIDQDLLPRVEALLGGPVRYSLINLFTSGAGVPYIQPWHRDLIDTGAAGEFETMARLHGLFLQTHAPLRPHDDFLHLVPGSHRRPATPADLAAAERPKLERPNPDAPATPAEVAAMRDFAARHAMPGSMVIDLEPGDAVFYDANLWHRGWGPEGRPRMTIISAWWRAHCPVMRHEHGQRDALRSPGHLDRMPAGLRACLQRYLDAYPQGEPQSFHAL